MLRKVTDMDLLPVAQIVKSYDINGDVVIRLSSDLLEDLNFKKEPVFIYFDGLPVPFFITSFKTKGTNGAIVKFETIKDFSHAEELIKKEIFIDTTNISRSEDQDNPQALAAFLMGFTILNQDNAAIGKVTDYFNYPGNPCIEINGKHLIPFNEDLIIKVNDKKKSITMTIPAGLIEED